MARVIDGTKVASHGLFYMESAGGSNVEVAEAEAAALRVERRPRLCAVRHSAYDNSSRPRPRARRLHGAR
jgi:hypothetical protein